MKSHSQSGSPFEAEAGYSRAVRVGSRIVVSGTAATTPAGVAMAPGQTYEQTKEALARALAAVHELGGSRDDVVLTRLYLAPEATWRDATRAHGEAFDDVRPANTTLFVHGFIPEAVLVEVELEAIVDATDVSG
jgi:enamine deaminase RidA (YjgF/YER057c/UK114 family)